MDQQKATESNIPKTKAWESVQVGNDGHYTGEAEARRKHILGQPARAAYDEGKRLKQGQ